MRTALDMHFPTGLARPFLLARPIAEAPQLGKHQRLLPRLVLRNVLFAVVIPLGVDAWHGAAGSVGWSALACADQHSAVATQLTY
jgi:hypothetical protein